MKHFRPSLPVTLLGLALTLPIACQKERPFVGLWRSEIDKPQMTDIHNVYFFSDRTCSWNDSIFDKNDSVWRTGSMGGVFALDGKEALNAAFSQKVLTIDTVQEADTTIIRYDSVLLNHQYTFEKHDKALYCPELDLEFVWIKRMR